MERSGSLKLYVISLILAILLPVFVDTYYQHVLILILFWTYLGAAWNIIGGYAGQFSVGHAAFFGIGAYTSSVLFVDYSLNPWAGMLLGGMLAMLFGIFIGYLCFRYGLRGPYFALSMMACAEMLRVIAVNLKVVKGALGVLIPLGNSFWIFSFKDRLPYYYIILGMTVAVVILTEWIQESKLGHYFVAIREDEDSASALGVNIRKYKIIAMGLSAFWTALGGTFYAQYYYYIDPNLTFGIPISVDILLRPIVGGAGTVLGPLVGSILLTPLSELSRDIFREYGGLHVMIFGSILIAVVIFLPRGVIGLCEDLRAKFGSIYGRR